VFKIVPDEEVIDQIAALPAKALQFFAEAIDVLRLVPDNGLLVNSAKPSGLRDLIFGADGRGKITYLVLDYQQEVHLLRLQWAGEESD
jgi:hypothetical protein